MGQSTSLEMHNGKERLSNEFDFLHEQIRKHSLTLRQLTTLTYDELQSKINELNDLSSRFVDCNGKQLVFELNFDFRNDAPPVLWKGLVRVRCMKTNPRTRSVERYRDLNLKQFLQVYNTMSQMQGTNGTIEDTNVTEFGGDEEACCASSSGGGKSKGKLDEGATSLGGRVGGIKGGGSISEEDAEETTPVALRKKPVFNMSASLILDELESPNAVEECCICMEAKV
jgi:hypothetical protein